MVDSSYETFILVDASPEVYGDKTQNLHLQINRYIFDLWILKALIAF